MDINDDGSDGDSSEYRDTYTRTRFPNKPFKKYKSYQEMYSALFYEDHVKRHPELKNLTFTYAVKKHPTLVNSDAIRKRWNELNVEYEAAVHEWKSKHPVEAEQYVKRQVNIKLRQNKSAAQTTLSDGMRNLVAEVHNKPSVILKERKDENPEDAPQAFGNSAKLIAQYDVYEPVAEASEKVAVPEEMPSKETAIVSEQTAVSEQVSRLKRCENAIEFTKRLVKRLKLDENDEFLILNSLNV